MNKGENRESAVRISLIDVMYGVVLAYGFNFFDQASIAADYFRFFFAYAVIIIDWIYVHRLYWGWEYKYNSFFILDIIVLFLMSRLLYTSTISHDPYYWLWMSGLFMVYLIWDVLSKCRHLPSEYDWRYSIGGDTFAAIMFLAIYILFLKDILQPTISLNILMIIVYIIAILTWFKPLPQSR